MLAALNTRSVITMLGGNDVSLMASASSTKRRNRCLRKRESRLRRNRNYLSSVHPRFIREPTCLEAVSRDYLLANKENENKSYLLTVSTRPSKSHCDILRTSQSLCTKISAASSYELSDFESESITRLLSKEMAYHPNNAFLNYVNPNVEDKVNAALRNEAIFNLRFLHSGFFNLSSETFFKAVNLVDRFIVRVKVKPKYISCVSAACYYIAAKSNEVKSDVPNAESLVHISRCGGTAADLRKMEEIIRTKLAGDLDGVTSLDFIRAVLGSESASVSIDAITCLEVALCSVEVYRYRPSCLAIAALVLEKSLQSRTNIKKLEVLAKFCAIEWPEIQACASHIQELYQSFYDQMLPCSRSQLVWTLSRRTMLNMVSSSPPPLDTISEDSDSCEEDYILISS